MLTRNAIIRGGSRQWLKATSAAPLRQSRYFASPSDAPFTYEITDAAGTKVVSKDTGSATSSLAIVVKAGSRYETAPGLAHGLEHFAFKSTTKRSALWLTREVELMGGVLSTSLSRENIVYKARFLRESLPYFVELLSDVVTKTAYKHHEFSERVVETIDGEINTAYKNPTFIALEAAHGVAFHEGLGLDKLAVVRKYMTVEAIAEYGHKAFNKSNLALVASGAEHAEVTKYASEFLGDLPSGSPLKSTSSKYHGGESRNWSPAGNAMVIAFPGSAGSPNFKAEYQVLSYILGGEPTIKWTPGSSLLGKAVEKIPGVKVLAKNITYSDTGLFYISIAGSGSSVKAAAPAVVDVLKNLSNIKEEDVKRAIANAKFDYYSAAEENALSMENIGQSVIATGKMPQVEETVKAIESVTLDAVKKVASSLLSGKAAVGTVGDLHNLPYACDLGLNV